MSNTDRPAATVSGSTGASIHPALAQLPEKLRVHALAKLLEVSSREVLDTLAGMGEQVRSPQSSLDRAVALRVADVLLDTAEEPAAEVATVADIEDPEPVEPRAEEPASAVLAPVFAAPSPVFLPPAAPAARPVTSKPAKAVKAPPVEPVAEPDEPVEEPVEADTDQGDQGEDDNARRRRRRGRRGRGRGKGGQGDDDAADSAENSDDDSTESAESAEDEPAENQDVAAESADEDEQDEAGGDNDADGNNRRRRRRRRRKGGADGEPAASGEDDPPNTVVHVRTAREARAERAERAERADSGQSNGQDEVRSVRGSTRLEAKRQRRRDGREAGRRRVPILSESEFLARREAVDRKMIVHERTDGVQIGVLEDGVLVEHFITTSGTGSLVGNVYLGRVQNVLPSMEAAFVDIGRGRNAVLYAGEVDWDAAGLEGKARKIEQALSTGDSVLVQVTKDPVGHKGARLTTQISLPGRFLVYVPGGGATGISRKLPDNERKRLKDVLKRVVPEDAGVIIRTASEGVAEEELARDVRRLRAQWEVIKERSTTPKAKAPQLLYEEPDLLIKVIRDLFTEDFSGLVVQGANAWDTIEAYVKHVAPDLMDRLRRHVANTDVFTEFRIDEQILKALDRKVWLPSGGYLVIDRTEAMTVIDVNTGKFTGSGGNLEETVTRNNLEAAEEIVRQLRLRDIGGIIVIDFIDMVLESNRDLVLRRLTECLGRDRTRHQVAEVTSLGLVQMTRKRVGTGLLEAYSTPCEHCRGRGVVVSTALHATVPVPAGSQSGHSGGNNGGTGNNGGSNGGGNGGGNGGSAQSGGRKNRHRDQEHRHEEPAVEAAVTEAAPAVEPTRVAEPAVEPAVAEVAAAEPAVAEPVAAQQVSTAPVNNEQHQRNGHHPAAEPAAEPASDTDQQSAPEPSAEPEPAVVRTPTRRRREPRRAAVRPAGPPVSVEG
jgi:ribonuclease E